MDHRKFRTKRYWGHILSMPFIYLPLLAVWLADISCEIYQAVCFPIYGLEKAKRSEYIAIKDRSKLAYLSVFEKIGCMYCGYVNGLLLYMKEIAGRTEKYWCGIVHESKPGFKPHPDQIAQDFAKFNDEKDCTEKYGE
jgi:hypothetical protein